ncbi:protein FAR1-RELATED SEQUENCE 5-like [Vigna radiata var. radiata]|uniref:Protein FAR1-RELATED SEQUENCE 5-like n=1 Tax=Vigna radiata var. radiata TaxID=3916 RepID=A0A1S3UAP2_VIGRR|nr:protein FAR1-RELATED SEQUENCE 5-like [Vigna radiata var. radiata]
MLEVRGWEVNEVNSIGSNLAVNEVHSIGSNLAVRTSYHLIQHLFQLDITIFMSMLQNMEPLDMEVVELEAVELEGVPSCEFNTDDVDNMDNNVPKLQMSFDSIEQVKSFYRDYAVSCGFAVRIRSSKKNNNNQLTFMKLVCSRQGKYISSISPEFKTQPNQRNECPTEITVSLKEGRWYVRTVVTEHNHDMCPKNSNLIRGNRKLNMHLKHTLTMNDDAGVRINKSFISLVKYAGGYENIQFIECDARNYIGQQRRSFCKDRDGQTLPKYFSRMRELNNEFFYEMEMDEHNRICSYENALRQKAQKENEADFVSLNSTIPCGSQSLIERQYQMEYTQAKFVEVQKEFRSRMNCFIKNMSTKGCRTTYNVKEEFIWEGQCGSKFYVVDYDSLSTDIHCSCKLFEFRGILCRHCLLVLGQEDVRTVPTKHVLRCWSKNVRRRHTLITSSYSNHTQEPKMQIYQTLCKCFYDIVEEACHSETASKKLLSELNSIGRSLGVRTSPTLMLVNDDGFDMHGNPPSSEEGRPPCEVDGLVVRSLVSVKRKGRPRTKRMQSTLEKLTKKKKSHGAKNKHTTNHSERTDCHVTNIHNVEDLGSQQMLESQVSQSGFMSLLTSAHYNNDNVDLSPCTYTHL